MEKKWFLYVKFTDRGSKGLKLYLDHGNEEPDEILLQELELKNEGSDWMSHLILVGTYGFELVSVFSRQCDQKSNSTTLPATTEHIYIFKKEMND